MNCTIVDIDPNALLDAAFPNDAEAEFRKYFGREPEQSERDAGLHDIVEIAKQIERIVTPSDLG